MLLPSSTCALLLLALSAESVPASTFGHSLSCADAAGVVEQRLGLPSGLLHSIGAVETGNRPFAVDADGMGRYFPSADAAIAFVRRDADTGHFFDVGCFQIDLTYHPDAFRSLDDAFDPLSNATAAGRYLLALRRGSSSWFEAVARYHSGRQDPGRSYASQVYASLGPTVAFAHTDARRAFGIRIIVPTAYEIAPAPNGRWSSSGELPLVQTP